MENSNFVSDVQKLQNALNNKDLKFIKEQVKTAFDVTYSKKGKEIFENEIGIDILKLVSESSNDFTKDIATKTLENKYELSEKQAWCIAYQVINNIELYVLAYNEYLEIQNQKFSSENNNEENELTKGEKFMIKYYDLIKAERAGKTKITAFMIKHNSEPRFFTKEQKDYWKKWSLSFEKVAIFTNLDYALDILNKLNEEERTIYQKENNLQNEKLHTIVETTKYI